MFIQSSAARSRARVVFIAGSVVAVAVSIAGAQQPATPPAATPPPAAAPAARQPANRTVKCDPIVGSGSLNGGKTYPVTSSASSARPTGCGEAHSVLLSALSSGGTTVGGWNCKTDTSGDPIVVCRSGTRTILARG